MMNKRMVLVGSSLALLSLTACVADTYDASDEVEDVGSADAPLICGSEDWDELASFATDGDDYLVGAHYGTAVGRIGGCSGVLYDNRHFLTAHHCYHGVQQRTLRMGKFDGAETFARGRIRDLGASNTNSYAASVDNLKEFTCNFAASYATSAHGQRDVVVYRCDPNEIPGLGKVWPGDIWGHAKLQGGRPSEGTDVYVVSVNKRGNESVRNVLLSPDGEVTDSVDGCTNNTFYDNCFEHDADTMDGSSGGPIFRRSTNAVFGLVHGKMGDDFDTCSAYRTTTNYGAYLPAQSSLPHSLIEQDSIGWASNQANSPWVGGNGGSQRVLDCPSGYRAAGIIGQTHRLDPEFSRRVGNFGLVCVPFVRDNSQATRATTFWKVVVGGSYDTDFQVGTFDYDSYLNEVLTPLQGNGTNVPFLQQQQAVTMCKPGYFVTGVTVQSGTYVDRIESIECTHHARVGCDVVSLRRGIGSRTSTLRTTRCPAVSGSTLVPDRAARGIVIRSGWVTDGFALRCDVTNK